MQQKSNEKENIVELENYFRKRIPDCQVNSKWLHEFGWVRFYFEKDKSYQYILDVSRNVLEDWSASKIIKRLEAANWQAVPQGHPRQLVRFSQNGFTFNQWPS
jgi:hypothetical protein